MKKRKIIGVLAALSALTLLFAGCGSQTAVVYDTDATAATNANVVVNERTLPSYTIPQRTMPTSVRDEVTLKINKVGNHGQVDLTPVFNKDVFSNCSNPSDGAFDDQSRHMSSQGVNDFAIDGVPYHFGPFADGQNNAMFCDFQELVFAKPFQCDSIRLIVSSKNGNYFTNIFVEYTDGSVMKNTIDSPDWCNNSAPDRAYTVPHAHFYTAEKDTWESNHERYLFVRELDTYPGKSIKKIVIGEDITSLNSYINIAIFSMTAVNIKGG